MKLATFRKRRGPPQIGLVDVGIAKIFDLAAAAARANDTAAPFASMQSLIDSGERGLDQTRRLADARAGDVELWSPLSEIELLPPVPEPRQMRDGMSFPKHIRQAQRGMRRLAAGGNAAAIAEIEREALPELAEVYRQVPIYYITNRLIVRGPGATVTWPRYSRVMDFELEFGIFTHRTAANIRAADAGKHIFGYTIFNDFSARDAQRIEMQGWLGPAKGKSFDGGNVIGPWIVTPDEVGDPYGLAMEARVNGEVWTRSTSSGMLFSFEEIIAYMSRDETLHAGEFIGSGTVGDGCGLELGRFLQHRDLIELEVERIGVLANRVEQQAS
jgi:2-keto-4-pentenoate hydratase/2-oxohepta-3-ene-1,7-dioic acid hydratase in catechol pathway